MKISDITNEKRLKALPDEAGYFHYDDGRVYALVQIPEEHTVLIHDFSARTHNQGDGKKAVIWLKQHFSSVGVIDPGDVESSQDVLSFWTHMANQGLIDTMYDEDDHQIYKNGHWI